MLAKLIADDDCFERISLVKDFLELPYEKRLRRLDLHSLNMHRLRGDLTAANVVLTGGWDLDPCLFFIPPVRPGLKGLRFEVL